MLENIDRRIMENLLKNGIEGLFSELSFLLDFWIRKYINPGKKKLSSQTSI